MKGACFRVGTEARIASMLTYLLTADCVTLGKHLNFSEPQNPYLSNEDPNTYPPWRPSVSRDEIMHGTHLVHKNCFVHSGYVIVFSTRPVWKLLLLTIWGCSGFEL